MKRLNKKGFTLIELLAVIIILGVLMIIAIPAVTKYINDSRKSAFVDSGVHFVDAVSKEAINGKDLKMYDADTLYLVAVGHEKANSCISLDQGGKSPYSETWDFAYVGVTYSNDGYNYYFIAQDGSGKRMPFTENKVLVNSGTDEFDKANAIDDDLAANLKTQYTATSQTDPAFDEEISGNDLTTGKYNLLTTGLTKTKVVFITQKGNQCKYPN